MGSNKVPLHEGVYYNSIYSCLESPKGEIHLTPNEKKILEIILDGRGRKDTIIDEIWRQQGVIVSESSYHQLVKMIRRKFVAAGLPSSCLKTIPRYGIVYVSEPAIKPDCTPEFCDINMNPLAIVAGVGDQQSGREVTAQEEVNTHRVGGFTDNKKSECSDQDSQALMTSVVDAKGSSLKISYLLSFVIFIFTSVALLLFLNAYETKNYFVMSKQIDNVNYYITPATKLAPSVWQNVVHNVTPATKNVYIASNGPKVWVAYCENNIYKDHVPCTYEHFSVY
ncbi:MAG: hypothetical protein P4L95_16615 [Rouxiella aceris]|uniref:winged helix-turn-helix domain-containing protein n=1 Tax=Rouxiella aceris TaxID=2703884 RepID=UPI00283F36BF|nr:hypothetical protein [Rouxiella aceris]MDR3433498.1 hypothetical protein [Rouxiella aceris]